MTESIKYSYIFFIYWIIFLIIPSSHALEMTTGWDTPKTKISEQIQVDAKPLRLQLEKIIQIYEKKSETIESQIKISPFDRMQMDLIQARIFARKGLFPEAMKIYEHLILKYPDSLDIRADYADVLLEYGVYNKADVQIQHLIHHESYRMRGFQMMAVLYDRQNLSSWTLPLYDNLLNQYPDNDTIWLDYANQRSKVGHWQKALNAYARILENDPENIYVLRDVHNILLEKRPAFHAQFIQFSSSDDTIRSHQQYTWRYTLTESLTFRNLFEKIHIKIPKNFLIVSQDIQQTSMECSFKVSSRILFTGRLFYYTGPVDDVSMYGAVYYRLEPDIEFELSYLGPSSWFDPIQAMDNDGRYEEFQLSLSTRFFDRFRINTSLANREYALDQVDDYGDRLNFHVDISRRILNKPDTTFIFALDQGRFSYNTDNKDVPMVLEENTYSLSTYIQDQAFSCLNYFLSAGYRWDSQRSLSGFFVNPGLGWHFSSKLRVDLSYSYSSESTGVVQGSTQTCMMNGMIIF